MDEIKVITTIGNRLNELVEDKDNISKDDLIFELEILLDNIKEYLNS